jgi:hypothetical protein
VKVCQCGNERRHWCVHEAAHAVAAHDFGVPFLHVSVLDGPVPYEEVRGVDKNGGLAIDRDQLLPLWPLRSDGDLPRSSMLAVALAGETGEQVVIGHILDEQGSFGDFRTYVGWLPQDGGRPESWEEAKRRDPVTVQRIAVWAMDRRNEIECVAAELNGGGRLTAVAVARLLR